MPYVYRDTFGRIVAGYDTRQEPAQEFLEGSAPEWRTYREAEGTTRVRRLRDELSELDRDLSRSTEDLIAALTASGALAHSLLPQPLMAKVAYKERLRMRLRAELQALGG